MMNNGASRRGDSTTTLTVNSDDPMAHSNRATQTVTGGDGSLRGDNVRTFANFDTIANDDSLVSLKLSEPCSADHGGAASSADHGDAASSADHGGAASISDHGGAASISDHGGAASSADHGGVASSADHDGGARIGGELQGELQGELNLYTDTGEQVNMELRGLKLSEINAIVKKIQKTQKDNKADKKRDSDTSDKKEYSSSNCAKSEKQKEKQDGDRDKKQESDKECSKDSPCSADRPCATRPIAGVLTTTLCNNHRFGINSNPRYNDIQKK